MARTLPLLLVDQVTLNAAGAGTITMRVPNYEERWRVRLAAIVVSPVPPATELTNEPVAKLTQNGYLVAGTYTGGLNSTDLDLDLQMGQFIECLWTGGDVGAVATLTIQGEKIIGGH